MLSSEHEVDEPGLVYNCDRSGPSTHKRICRYHAPNAGPDRVQRVGVPTTHIGCNVNHKLIPVCGAIEQTLR